MVPALCLTLTLNRPAGYCLLHWLTCSPARLCITWAPSPPPLTCLPRPLSTPLVFRALPSSPLIPPYGCSGSPNAGTPHPSPAKSDCWSWLPPSCCHTNTHRVPAPATLYLLHLHTPSSCFRTAVTSSEVGLGTAELPAPFPGSPQPAREVRLSTPFSSPKHIPTPAFPHTHLCTLSLSHTCTHTHT